MEGLIPVVYKSFKRNITRRKYECLSSGTAQAYNTEDFCTKDDDQADRARGIRGAHHRRFDSVQIDHLRSLGAAPAHTIEDFCRKYDDHQAPGRARGICGAHHRRFNSVQVDHLRSFASEDDSYKPGQLVRFQSQRMLSCLTGA